MFGYRHAFHAGNVADVFKHTVLSALLQALTAKPAALAYLDTHAGAGRYDLDAEAARRNAEYRCAAGALWKLDPASAPPAAASLLTHLQALNGDRLRHYPGSPAIAARLLRDQDRLLLCERLAAEHTLLAAAFAGDRRVRVLHEDGYAALKAALPPAHKRALVLIDPAYEDRREGEHVARALDAALQRFGHGVYAVWLPLRGKLRTAQFVRRAVGPQVRQALLLDLQVAGDAPGALPSAMLIINPPYSFQTAIDAELDWLCAALPAALEPRWQRNPVDHQTRR